eukprot:12281691-Alexandrium_andersonii.AAC.1
MQRARGRSHDVQRDPHREHSQATTNHNKRNTAMQPPACAQAACMLEGRGRDSRRRTPGANHAAVKPTAVAPDLSRQRIG